MENQRRRSVVDGQTPAPTHHRPEQDGSPRRRKAVAALISLALLLAGTGWLCCSPRFDVDVDVGFGGDPSTDPSDDGKANAPGSANPGASQESHQGAGGG